MALFNFDCSIGVQWKAAILLTSITRKLGKKDVDSFCLNFKFVFFRLKMKSSVVFKFNVMLFLISHLPKGWVSRIVLYWFKCYEEFRLMRVWNSVIRINPTVTVNVAGAWTRGLPSFRSISSWSKKWRYLILLVLAWPLERLTNIFSFFFQEKFFYSSPLVIRQM